MLLGDTEMQKPTKKYPYLSFSENAQTMFGDSWTGAKVVWAEHMGKGRHPNMRTGAPMNIYHPINGKVTQVKTIACAAQVTPGWARHWLSGFSTLKSFGHMIFFHLC
jgi:hypothetical protein